MARTRKAAVAEEVPEEVVTPEAPVKVDDRPKGADGKNPISPQNPSPKAVL